MAISRINITQPNITSSSISRASIAGSGIESVLALNPIAMYDVSVLSSLYQDSAKTTPVTGTSQPVGAFSDISGNGHHFTQDTALSKPTFISSGGDKYLDFDGGDSMAVATSTALFKYLHDGTGCSIIAGVQTGNVASPGTTMYYLSSGRFATDVGVNFRYDDAFISDGLEYFTNNGNTGQSGVNNSSVDAITPNTGQVISTTYSTAATCKNYVNGVFQTSASDIFTPSTANSTYNLRLGARGEVSTFLTGRIYAIIIFDRVLPDSERITCENYVANRITGLSI